MTGDWTTTAEYCSRGLNFTTSSDKLQRAKKAVSPEFLSLRAHRPPDRPSKLKLKINRGLGTMADDGNAGNSSDLAEQVRRLEAENERLRREKEAKTLRERLARLQRENRALKGEAETGAQRIPDAVGSADARKGLEGVADETLKELPNVEIDDAVEKLLRETLYT